VSHHTFVKCNKPPAQGCSGAERLRRGFMALFLDGTKLHLISLLDPFKHDEDYMPIYLFLRIWEA